MWENLEVEVDICERCKLGKKYDNVRIVGQGNQEAEIFFLMDDMKRCYFSTLTNCYKADNIIEEENISACSVFLDTQIALVNPKYIISVGERPTKALIKSQKVDIKKMFGKEYDYFGITVIPIYDIDYFLNKTTDKEKWKIANIFANI